MFPPVGKQKQVPKPTPPSLYSRGLNMQREFCWDPPIQSVTVPTWVAGLVWTYTHTPLVTAELLHLPTQAGSFISCLPLPTPPTPSVPLFEQDSWAAGVTGKLSRPLVLNGWESITIFWPLLQFSFPPKAGFGASLLISL